MFYPEASKEDDLINQRGGDERIRAVQQTKEKHLGGSCDVRKLITDVCCEVEASSLSRSRSGESESNAFVFDFEVQRYGSKSFHQRINLYAADLFRNSLKVEMDPLEASSTTVISFILNKLMYMTKPELFSRATDDSDLIGLVRGEHVTFF